MAKTNLFNNLFNFMDGFRGNSGINKTGETFTILEKGTSGTEIYGGYFSEEHISKLLGENGLEAYDEMRRSDAIVAMLLDGVKNPIKSANWVIEAVDESELEQEKAEFARYILFKDIKSKNGKRTTFYEFLDNALTMIEFGHSVFEVCHKVVRGNKKFGDYIGISDLGFRQQRSIKEWHLQKDGSIDYVRQLVNGDLMVDVLIEGWKLLTFAIRKEGDNYEGISKLRPCYANYFRKNVYRKLQAVGIERCAKGIPIGIVSEEIQNAPDYEVQIKAFQAMLDKLSANEKNGIVIPMGTDLKELKITHDAEKVQKVIEAENIEMASAFLATFMMLGTSGKSGSYSLGADLSQLFLNGLQNIGYMIADKITEEVLTPLIKAKYGESEEYPKLTVSGIADKLGTEFADIVSKLISAGAIQVSPNLQRHIHSKLELPDVDEELLDKQQEKKVEEPKEEPTPPPAPKAPTDKNNNQNGDKKKLTEQEKVHFLGENGCGENGEHSCNCGCNHLVKMTEEQKKQFPISAFIEKEASDLELIMKKGLGYRSNEMITQLEEIMKTKGKSKSQVISDVLKLKMPKSEVYEKALRKFMSDLVDKTVSSTLKEVGVSEKGFKFADEVDKLPSDIKRRLVDLVMLTSDTQDYDFEKIVYFTFNANYGKVEDDEVIELVTNLVDEQLDKGVIATAAVNTTSKTINDVRQEVFMSPEVEAKIESYVFTNGDPVSLICQTLNGRVFSKEEYNSSSNIPPLHHNCKSYIVPQMVGAENNKPLTSGGLTIDDPAILKTKTL